MNVRNDRARRIPSSFQRKLISRAALAASCLTLLSCGGGGSGPSGPTPAIPATLVPASQPSTADTGAGGSQTTDYPSPWGTREQIQALESQWAARLFNVLVSQVSAVANVGYNSFGMEGSCAKKGYAGGHAGFDVQTSSVAAGKTADETVHAPVNGIYVRTLEFDYGITVVLKTLVFDPATGKHETLFVHLLHLRAVEPLVPGTLVTVGTRLGIQGGTSKANPNEAEHVHTEFADRDVTPAATGANPALCGLDGTRAARDPYPVLERIYKYGSSAPDGAAAPEPEPEPVPSASNKTPLLEVAASCSRVKVGEACEISLQAQDPEGQLASVALTCEGRTQKKAAAGGSATLRFQCTPAAAGSIAWSARAYDAFNARSQKLEGSFQAREGAEPLEVQRVLTSTDLLDASAGPVWLVLIAKGLQPGARVTLTSPRGETFPNCCRANDASPIVTSSSISVRPDFFGDAGTWTARVTNPDGASSSIRFSVKP